MLIKQVSMFTFALKNVNFTNMMGRCPRYCRSCLRNLFLVWQGRWHSSISRSGNLGNKKITIMMSCNTIYDNVKHHLQQLSKQIISSAHNSPLNIFSNFCRFCVYLQVEGTHKKIRFKFKVKRNLFNKLNNN